MLHSETFRHDKLEFQVEIRGRASEALLFLPGMGVHPRHYSEGLDRLARRFTVVAPDLSFGSNRILPEDIEGYLTCIDDVARKFAPDAPRAGHSLGGMLAMLGDRRAIGLSPMIPVPLTWFGQVWRATRLQVREFAGAEGRRGVSWAWAMLTNYVSMVLTAPVKLFPTVSCAHRDFDEVFRPRAPGVRLVLGHFDQLYTQSEYQNFAEASGLTPESIKWLPRGHDWPATHPELLEREVLAAIDS
jgi:pimeloyl-ACP methyl ester carboxylesterase